ncbi:MAG TPA: alpha/beta hydrolase [Anaerolineales bacterium]|nr:alpha/beta hydrolase [Anaerolineales bacterium]
MAEIANLNGFEIRFEIHGEGIPIVYTPGGFYPLEQGRVVAERLSSLGYKVLLWDRPNTGGSGLLFRGDNLIQIWANKLRDLLHYTGLSPAFVSGGSAGGLGSLYFSYIYPAEVKGLILIAPPTDDQEIWAAIEKETFLERAEAADEGGMTAALEAAGGMWDLFIWPEQFERVPQKKQQFLSMDPQTFAEAMRAWARSLMAGERPYFAGLSDVQLAMINIPTIVFSGPGGFHPQHTAEALHERLPQSTLVISAEYYAEAWDQILRDIEEKGGEYFDVALAGRIDEFVRSML